MAIARISPQDLEKQIIGDVSDGARKEFEGILDHWPGNVKWTIERYYRNVKWLRRVCRKLKNPINARTGEPLKGSTIKQYWSHVSYHKRNIENLKGAIRLLILHGYMGQKTRARWIRRYRLKKVRTVNCTKGLAKQEKRFVEAYRGNPIWAAVKAGCPGNFPELKKIGYEIYEKKHIKKALRLKVMSRASEAGLAVIFGEGQGKGKPFKCKPDSIPKQGPISSHEIAVRIRISRRLARIMKLELQTSLLDHDSIKMLTNTVAKMKEDNRDLDAIFDSISKQLAAMERRLGISKGIE